MLLLLTGLVFAAPRPFPGLGYCVDLPEAFEFSNGGFVTGDGRTFGVRRLLGTYDEAAAVLPDVASQMLGPTTAREDLEVAPIAGRRVTATSGSLPLPSPVPIQMILAVLETGEGAVLVMVTGEWDWKAAAATVARCSEGSALPWRFPLPEALVPIEVTAAGAAWVSRDSSAMVGLVIGATNAPPPAPGEPVPTTLGPWSGTRSSGSGPGGRRVDVLQLARGATAVNVVIAIEPGSPIQVQDVLDAIEALDVDTGVEDADAPQRGGRRQKQ